MRFRLNPYCSRTRRLAFHQSLPGYGPTPLVLAPELAGCLGIRSLQIKDESARFGLNAFKVLGASWAMHCLAEGSEPPETFSAATDGNHGRAVAWMARRIGARAVIFIPANMSAARVRALRSEGAEVVRVDGTYDEAVTRCAGESAVNGWQVISDTGYPGYLEIPELVMQGYETLFEEASRQREAAGLADPDVLLIQGGVGGLLCAAVRQFRGRRTRIVAVEPDDADCLLTSICAAGGEPAKSAGSQNSIMSGLNCGEVSLAAWCENRAGVDFFISIEDRFAEDAMRRLAPEVVAGESGAAGLAGLIALCEEERFREAREAIGIGPNTIAMVVNTEGATDPEAYRRVVG